MKRKLFLAFACLTAAMALNAQKPAQKTIEYGGSGPYKAVAVSEPSLPGYTIYRPVNMAAAVEGAGVLPVVIWGNGGCADTSISHEKTLNEVASHGYVIIACGPLRMSARDGYKVGQSTGEDMSRAIDWVAAQSRDENSPYFRKVSGFRVAVAGQSCGGAQLMSISDDRRISTYLMVNSGMGDMEMSGASKENLKKVHGPVLYLLGGKSDIAYDNAVKDFDNLPDNVPVAFVSTDCGHGGTFDQKNGGSYSRMMVDWLEYTMRNNQYKLSMFRDMDLAKYPGYTGKSKNFPSEFNSYPDCHDPVVAFCDGRYYMFTTGMNVMSSTDQKNWRKENSVFTRLPQWALDKGFNGMPWAPDIMYHDGLWYIYYSCSGFGKNKSAIGVAVNKTLNPESPDFKWEDKGMVVESIPGRDEWNAIDPNAIVDENGDGWLVFGSFWRGIKMFKLDKTLTRIAEPQIWYPVARRPEGTAPDTVSTDTAVHPDPRGLDFDAGNGAIEAPFIFRHGDWYYLFVSFDLCCRGAKSTYNVVVGRSKTVYGPYFDKDGVNMMNSGGTTVVKANDQYAGCGHCAVVNFDGKDYIYFHAYDKDYNYASKLVVREMEWSADGWPVVKL